MKKKKIIIISVCVSVFIALGILAFVFFYPNKNEPEVSKLKELPKPEITGGARGELGIDKNINEATIDEYLNRPDSVYRDMRMLEDPGNYEAIGGDRYLSGYIEGFEVIPLPYIVPVTGLPNEVGDTYTGTTLFYDDNGTYVANYEESMDIIEEIFPKDKVIFLMCGGGGYAGITKNFLVSLGWDENKIYNIGGYWYYKGEHSINVKRKVDGVTSYDFESVPYHNIEFNKLTKSDNYKAPIIKVTELKINTSKIELEEGTSFKLNAIVLPNEATNKEVKWISDNEMVATVNDEGLVQAVRAGNTTITVQSVEGDKIVSCEVIVNKKEISTRVELDDLSEEIEEFASYDLMKIDKEFSYLYDTKFDTDGKIIPDKYHEVTTDGKYETTELWREEVEKKKEKEEQAKKKRLEIFNELIDNKKTFIILIESKNCEDRPYLVFEGADKILNQNNYQYLKIGSPVTNGEETLQMSKIDSSKINGSIAIIKDGEIYASMDPDVDAIKSDEELVNWLSKYIDI